MERQSWEERDWEVAIRGERQGGIERGWDREGGMHRELGRDKERDGRNMEM